MLRYLHKTRQDAVEGRAIYCAQSRFRTQQCAEKVKLTISQSQLHQRLFSDIFNGQGSSITVISTSILCLSLQYVVVFSYCIKPV